MAERLLPKKNAILARMLDVPIQSRRLNARNGVFGALQPAGAKPAQSSMSQAHIEAKKSISTGQQARVEGVESRHAALSQNMPLDGCENILAGERAVDGHVGDIEGI